MRASFFGLVFAVLRGVDVDVDVLGVVVEAAGGESDGASGVLAGEALVVAPMGDIPEDGNKSNILPRDCDCDCGVNAVGRVGKEDDEAGGEI